MRVLVLGANGQLGRQFNAQKNSFDELLLAPRQSLDILDFSQAEKILKTHKADVVINCAAYTDVVGAEKNRKQAYAVNHSGVGNLADICHDVGTKLIHISTDSVFDGRKMTAYIETDNAQPLNEYSKSKWAGEQVMLQKNSDTSSVVRVSWLYSNFGNNFYEKILSKSMTEDELKIVNDQVSTPTYARGLVEFISNALIYTNHDGCELFHYSDFGEASWYDFAKEIVKLSGGRSKVTPISTTQFSAPVLRPKYTVLSHQKVVKKFDYLMTHWKENLERCLYDRKH
ncbi:MAG: dTDP-4-dehydrorhamnose reductase [Bacteroidia bacterium]|jgi:dTDP-4-dehydrorhamnose reductase